MAVIEKIRTKFGVAASIIIAVGLLLFIIDPSEIMSAVQNMSSKYDVGKIGSKSISYQDFQNDVEKYTRIHELVSGNTVSGEQEQMQVRNAAWQALVEKYLFSKNAKAAGLAVGEAENLALLTSEEYVSPLIANDPSFADETGSFSPEAVKNIARQAKENPDLKLYWDYVQNSVYFQQLNAKYNALFTASNFQNPLQLRKAIEENNKLPENKRKPQNIIEKMLIGRLNKQFKEICLLDQVYVRAEDGKQTVGQYLDQVGKANNTKITIKEFVRFETGEGIEKRQDNFAEEVMAQAAAAK